jgi:hypothetical protein
LLAHVVCERLCGGAGASGSACLLCKRQHWQKEQHYKSAKAEEV